jgi:hypothetical protein
MWKEYLLSEKFIDEISNKLLKQKFKYIPDNSYSTINGQQTQNIIALFSKEELRQMIPFDEFYDKIFHIHYITYDHGGYQTVHHHAETEKQSFILYLNNADGETCFLAPLFTTVKPQKGKVIIFDSRVQHFGAKAYKNKKLLVGAINKRWE